MAYPLTPAAAAALKELDFPIVDAHHHVWGDATVPRIQNMMGKVDFSKFNRAPIYPPKKGVQPEQPLPDEAIEGLLKGLDASFGTHQVLLQDYTAEDLRKDFAEAVGVTVESTVHLECGWLAGPKDGETKHMQTVADATGNQICAAIVGTVDMLEPDVSKTEAALRAHMESPNFRGIRMSVAYDPEGVQMPHAPEADITVNPNFLKSMELFRPSKLDLEFDIWCYGFQMPSVAAMISKFPDVRFVLNHFGTPLHVGTNEAVWADWQRDIKLVAAASPNVYAKLSGLMAMLDLGFGMHKETWPNAGPSAEQIAQSRFGEMIRQTVKAFGVDRCFFGSNFPVDKGMARYGELTAAFVIVLKEMGTSKEDMKKMFYSNAKRFYMI